MKTTPWWAGPLLLLLLGGAALGCGAQPSKQGLHRDCSDGSACSYGQACLEYTNIAGQPLRSCEIPCTYRSDCPEPLDCVAISDGPNQLICD